MKAFLAHEMRDTFRKTFIIDLLNSFFNVISYYVYVLMLRKHNNVGRRHW